MKRVLVTGASGFIGRHALAPLAARGYEVHAAARTPGSGPAQWHAVDLLDGDAARVLLARVRPTHLLHFAWYAEHGKFWTAPENRAWVDASRELLDAFDACGGERFVGAGSCAEYDWSAGHCVENATPLAPATLYGQCKDEFRRELETFASIRGISWAWGRVFHLYGPGEHPQRLAASVIHALRRGEPANCSAGEQLRDFLHVADLAAAFAALLDSAVQGPVNIASGVPIAIKDLVNEIGAQLRRPDLVRLGALPTRPGDPPRLTADVDRLAREVGWTPPRDLRAGLADTLART